LSTLTDFEAYLHKQDQTPALARIGLIHYQFEAIHPFLDGNGRTGRLLIPLLLVHWDLLPFPLLYLSVYFEKHRDRYNDLLLDVSLRGAWQEWLLFFLEGVAEQAADACDRAKQLQSLQLEWRESLVTMNLSLSVWVASLVDMLFDIPIVTASDVSERFGVVHQTAMRTLRRLAEYGIVEEVPGIAGNNQIAFVATRILNIFK
jgi:Fic family protein